MNDMFDSGKAPELVEDAAIAEALWDHVAMDARELGFRAGDLIQVHNTADKDWWWGATEGRTGWFPSSFVRVSATFLPSSKVYGWNSYLRWPSTARVLERRGASLYTRL